MKLIIGNNVKKIEWTFKLIVQEYRLLYKEITRSYSITICRIRNRKYIYIVKKRIYSNKEDIRTKFQEL